MNLYNQLTAHLYIWDFDGILHVFNCPYVFPSLKTHSIVFVYIIYLGFEISRFHQNPVEGVKFEAFPDP